jgi:alkanesulfonate monooxygenase SsuD/methylene tetrahydromethanopterin reductase-like flavin-dependent oxidoreductase (luciferase family)
MDFFLFLPQMRLPFDKLVTTARTAEEVGFTGMAGMDHLWAPGAVTLPTYEAMLTNMWIAGHTQRLKVGSLVLCDPFRHPSILAKQAVSLDHASGGRFELGIGWGSQTEEIATFGFTPVEPRDRVRRLRETLEIVKALWTGQTVDYDGEFFKLKGALQVPGPLQKIPILIGGGGPKSLALVREFADWWNLDIRHRAKYEPEKFAELRAQVGNARISIQQMVAYVPKSGDRKAITEAAMRRFGFSDPIVGTGPELLEHFAKRAEQGIERVYTWFCDFAPPETLAGFSEEVIAKLRPAA